MGVSACLDGLVRSTKKQIKDAVKKMYDIATKKVNTLIRYVVLVRVYV